MIFNLFLSLAIPMAAGQLLMWALFGRRYLPLALSLSLAYGLGLGVLTQIMLILGIAQIPFSVSMITLVLLSVTFLAYLCSRQLKQFSGQAFLTPGSPKLILLPLLIFVMCYVVFVFWRALNIPVYSWDVMATIAYKAKIFFYEKGLVPLDLLPHSSYPFHVSLLQTWIALNLDGWDDQLINIVLPFTFCAYLVIHYHFLKVLTDDRWAIMGTALLVSSKQFVDFATVPYVELFLIYYNIGSIMLIILWQRKGADGLLILAGLFSGFTTFCKLEGVAYLAIHTILLLLLLKEQKGLAFSQKTKKLLKFLIPSLGIYLLYFTYKALSHFPTAERTTLEFTWGNLTRIPVAFSALAKILFLSGNWNIIWFLLAVSFLNLSKKKWGGEIQWLTLTLGMFFGLYILVCLLITDNFAVLIGAPELFPRVILHFYPLVVLLVILLNSPNQKNEDLPNA